MVIKFSLHSPFPRLALTLSAVVVSGLLWHLVFTQAVISVISDPGVTLTPEALSKAATRYPNSPRVHARLAEAELGTTTPQESSLVSALLHATHAVNLSPHDFQLRRILADTQAANADSDAAEQSLYAAVRLAPQHAATNWALANLLLRQDKVAAALAPFRIAIAGDPSLLPAAFDLLWRAAERDRTPLKTVAGTNPEAQLALAQFLLEQASINEAVEVYRGIDPPARLNFRSSADFINNLIAANFAAEAYAVWLELVKDAAPQQAPSPSAAAAGIWNGDFESARLQYFDHFDWKFGRSDYVRFAIDQKAGRSGSRSLKLTFLGRDTTKLNGEVAKLLPVTPGARYELECYARSKDLRAPAGPHLAVLNNGDVLSASEPVATGDSDWQRLAVTFTAPANTPVLTVAIRRIPQFSYEEPMQGAVWFDDFALRKL